MKIEIATVISRTVAERWRSQYERDGKWTSTISGDSLLVYEKLLACENDPAKIAAIVGNKGWSYIACRGCSDYVLSAVVFSGYGDEEIKLCRTCLIAASAAINAVNEALA